MTSSHSSHLIAAAVKTSSQLIFCYPSHSLKMIALFNKLLDWFKQLFWKEEMELTLVGLQYSGKTTFVNVIAVISQFHSLRLCVYRLRRE